MEINSLTGGASLAANSEARLAKDFDQFLALLTAQLQNQDPLDPLNSNEFVQQLVSFTGVEQAIATNANLENLIAQTMAGQVASAVSYLGTTIEAGGDQIVLAGGEARFVYTLPEITASTSIVIANQNGETVFTGQGDTTAGDHGFVWDGRDANGALQPEGIYSIAVSAFALDDSLLSVRTIIGGRVTRVETDDDGIHLTVNGIKIPLEDILSVEESPPPA